VVKDPELHASLREIVRCVAQADSRMAREGAVIRSLRLLAGRHSQARPARLRDRLKEPGAVRRAREMIEDRYADDLSVGEIAGAVRLSRYHLMRVFREHAGLPLHAYQLQVRIERAKRMLAAGRAVVEVALDVGFADQSHFTKRFRSLVGLPPAAYRRCVLG
jgi:AraC-like DNA-binding protein